MKRSTTGGLAHQLEGMVAEDFKGYANRKLYVLDGQPGLYRRLTASVARDREKEGRTPPKGIYDGKVIHLERHAALEAELHEAGYASRYLPAEGLVAKTLPWPDPVLAAAEAGTSEPPGFFPDPSELIGDELPEMPGTVPESVAVGADGPAFVPPPDDNGL